MKLDRSTACRIVLSGCGAVSQLYIAKALARLEFKGHVTVVGLFDPDLEAVAKIQHLLPGAKASASFMDLIALDCEFAIIASPPAHHAEQCVAALNSGKHILCEKPLATNVADAERIIGAANIANRNAAVGLVRRHLPATRSIKAMLDRGLIGQLRAISCFEGGPFHWPVASLNYFRREQAGGGVLLDIGTHCLDLLTWWIGAPDSLTYADDALGGIETNCNVRLKYDGFTAEVRLSRDWALPNEYRLEGDLGSLHWTVNDPEIVSMELHSASTEASTQFKRPKSGGQDFIEGFSDQVVDLVQSVREGRRPLVSAEAGRDVLSLIERCYASRRSMPMPWLSLAERDSAAFLSKVR